MAWDKAERDRNTNSLRPRSGALRPSLELGAAPLSAQASDHDRAAGIIQTATPHIQALAHTPHSLALAAAATGNPTPCCCALVPLSWPPT